MPTWPTPSTRSTRGGAALLGAEAEGKNFCAGADLVRSESAADWVG